MTSDPTIAAIRFGYGLSPDQPPPADAAALLAGLAAPDTAAASYPVPGLAAVLPLGQAFTDARKANRMNQPGARDAVKAARRKLFDAVAQGFTAQVQRGVQSPDGFRERLQFFWSDHFTVVAKTGAMRPGPSAFAEEAIRPHLTGHFADMLRAVVTHPVMLLYLDQTTSIGPDSTFAKTSEYARKHVVGLNENLAREVLELHTLGVGAPYTQTDVRQFAKLLTGLGFNAERGFRFHPNWAEPGAETVLGKHYGGEEPAKLSDIYAALDDIAVNPATAHHIATKLAVHFVADTPDPALVAHMTDAYTRSAGHLPTVYAAMLEHPAAWAPLGAKARQPWDFMVASLRALGTPADRLAALNTQHVNQWLIGPLKLMGQPYQQPSGPNGWHEDATAWITPQGLAARIQWAMSVSRVAGRDLPDPRGFVQTALADAASPELIAAAPRAESTREGVGLILASADFNRR